MAVWCLKCQRRCVAERGEGAARERDWARERHEHELLVEEAERARSDASDARVALARADRLERGAVFLAHERGQPVVGRADPVMERQSNTRE